MKIVFFKQGNENRYIKKLIVEIKKLIVEIVKYIYIYIHMNDKL